MTTISSRVSDFHNLIEIFSGVNLIKYYALSGKPRDEIFSIFKDICKGTRYRPPEICDDLIELIGVRIWSKKQISTIIPN